MFSLAFTEVALWATVWSGWLWLALPLVLVAAHLMHGLLIGFHEASHGLLRKSRRLNEFDGVIIGVFSFLPFSLYRVVHQMHHMHLATEHDTELWPLVITKAPRWARRLAAFLELTVGLFYSPFIFLRVFLRRPSLVRSRKVRRRIWAELALTAVVWTAILTAIAFFGVWKYFLWMYLVPAIDCGKPPELAQIHRTRRPDRQYREQLYPKHRAEKLAWPCVCSHFASRTLSRRASSKCRIPHRVLPQFTSVLTPKRPGRRGSIHELSTGASGSDPQPRRILASERNGAMRADGHADYGEHREFVANKKRANVAWRRTGLPAFSHNDEPPARAAVPFAAS